MTVLVWVTGTSSRTEGVGPWRPGSVRTTGSGGSGLIDQDDHGLHPTSASCGEGNEDGCGRLRLNHADHGLAFGPTFSSMFGGSPGRFLEAVVAVEDFAAYP